MVEPEQSINTQSTEHTEKTTEEPKDLVRPPYTGDKGEVKFEFQRDTPIEKKPLAVFSYGKRVRIHALNAKFEDYVDHIIQVAGWARTTRMGGKDFAFIELNDGSGSTCLQVVVDSSMPNFDEIAASKVGASFKIKGKLIKSPAKGQLFELQVCHPELHACHVIGQCDGATYPLPTKRHTNEYLREHANLRPRTKLISAVTRVRNNLAYATHKFFQERGFLYIHTPLITASDCEGAGEMFQVTTVLPKEHEPVQKVALLEREGQEHEEEKKDEPALSKNAQKKLAKKHGKDAAAAKDEPKAAEDGEEKKDEEKKEEPKVIPFQDRKVNYKKDFFGKPAYLTVSGQLSVENFACGMGDVYTFGPTFRAENSNTTRHLAEFWMIEPEIIFADINDVMDLAEDYVKYCIRYVIENNADDIDFFNSWVDKELKGRLENVTSNVFTRLSYTDAIALLEEHVKDKKVKFLVKPEWGMDMGSEHERYLAEKVFKMPVCVYNYPKTFKAFYMRRNEDGKTVAAMDMLVPGIGELVGGSQREERLDELDKAIIEKGLELRPYWWYRESRMYGTQPHGGFGLGFERLVMMCTGVENIRDVIPFPRYPGNAEF